MPGTRPQLIPPEPWSRLVPGSTLRPPEGWFRALSRSAPGRQLLRCRGQGHLPSEALFQGGSAGWGPAGGGVPWTPSGGLCQWVGRTRLELLGPQRQKDGAGPKEEAGPECGRARGGGRGQAGRGPEDPRPLPPELLRAPAQGAGALQARVVSEPGALGPVPLLPAEQVRGTRRGADSAPWVPGSLYAASVPGPRGLLRPGAVFSGAVAATLSLERVTLPHVPNRPGSGSPARRSSLTRCSITSSWCSSSSTASPSPWKGLTSTPAAP